MRALLFINGLPPKNLPDTEGYDLIACSDGAFHYLKTKNFPLDKLNFVSGDFDSHSGKEDALYQDKFIYTPNQDKTDFEKSLEIILERGADAVDVYGGSGGEMDHFLGNLSVAHRFKDVMEITFFDEYSMYFFSPKDLVLNQVKNKMISLYPFPFVENITTEGLNWPLSNGSLSITTQIGTRNFAVEDDVKITYEAGDLIVFIGQDYL